MEHNHWGLEDHFPGWFLGSMWIFQGVPVQKIAFEFEVLPTLEFKTPAPRSDQNVNGPEASTKPFFNRSQNLWKGSFIYRKLVKNLYLFELDTENTPEILTEIHLRRAPMKNTVGWLAACSFRKCANLFCLGGNCKTARIARTWDYHDQTHISSS